MREEVSSYFKNIVQLNDIQLVSYSENEYILIAENFALRFQFEKNRLNLSYLDTDSNGSVRSFNMLQYLAERIRKEDRIYKASSTMTSMQAMTKLTLACLTRDSGDLWSGKKDWLQDDEQTKNLPEPSMMAVLKKAWGQLN